MAGENPPVLRVPPELAAGETWYGAVPPVAQPPVPPTQPVVAKIGAVATILSVWGKLPSYVKWPASCLILLVLVFYYRDRRVGNGFFADKPAEHDLGEGVKVRFYKHRQPGADGAGEFLVPVIVYKNGKELPADGLGVAVITEADHKKHPDRLELFRDRVREWPVVVFFNATGFDPTGEVLMVRHASDGSSVLDARPRDMVVLVVPSPDGDFSVFHRGGGKVLVSEKELVEKYMHLPYEPSQAELEKMTDEQLKARGYERVTKEEAEKRATQNKKEEPPDPLIRRPELPKE